jgi:type I restriction enzyme S subunit
MISEIPAGWSIKTVADICDKPQYGLTASANSSSDVGPKFLRITDITQSGVNWDKVPYCECQIDQIEKFRLYNNDILFARIGGTTGKSFIVKNPPQSVFASYLIRLRVLSEKDNPYYLYFYFQSPFYWQQINANKDNNLKGGVSASVLTKLKIISPSMNEQEKIAAILFKIQQAIEVQESIIEAAQELKKSTMQHVFTYGLRGEKTKETEIGRMPESWDVVAVKEAYEFVKKPTHLRYYDYDNIPFLPMDLIPNNTPHLTDYHLKKSFEIKSGTYFESGNLLISKITPCFENGKQCIASKLPNGFGIATTEVIPIRERDNISNKYYLFYYLLKNDVRSGIACKMEGATGRQRVPVHLLKDFSIPLPSLHEQGGIAEVFLTIDNKIEHHTAQKVALQDLFKTMLNKLMTGEIRVKDLDIDMADVKH